MNDTRDQSPVAGWLKEASRHSFVYGVGAALQASLSVLLLPVYTRQWSVEEFAVFQVVILAAALAGAAFYLGAYSSLSRFYFDHEDPAVRRMVAGNAACLTLIGATLQMAGATLAAVPLSRALLGTPDYAWYFVVGFAGSAVTFTNQIFLLMLRLTRRSISVVVTNLVALIATAAAVLWLVVVRHWGVPGALVGTVVGQAVVLPVLIWRARDVFVWRLTRQDVRAQLAFGLPAVVIGFGYYALDQADRIVLTRLRSLEEVGVYSLGYRIGMVVQMLFVQPFAQIWGPMRFEYRKHPDADRFYALVFTYYAMAGLALVAALSLFSREIVALVGSKPEYSGASRVVPLVLLSHLIYGTVAFLDMGILATKRLSYHIYLFWGCLALNVLLNLWWVPPFGYMGAAWATLVSYAVLSCAVYLVSNRLMAVATEPGRLLAAASSAVFTIVAGLSVPLSGVASIVTRCALLLGLLGLWWRFVLSADERAGGRQAVSRVLHSGVFRRRRVS